MSVFSPDRHSRLYHAFPPQIHLTSPDRTIDIDPLGFDDRHVSMRFSPVMSHGAIVPTYYAAFHYIDAIVETLARKNAHGVHQWSARLPDYALAHVDTTRRLQLVDCEAYPGISDALRADKTRYSELQGFSTWVYETMPDIDGLGWYGFQHGEAGHRCVMLFGDRVAADDLELRAVQRLWNLANRWYLHDTANRFGMMMPEAIF